MPNVIIVSNRLPVSVNKVDGKLTYSASIGGLATGLASFVNKRGNKWIGWPGIVSEELTDDEKQQITRHLKREHCYPVFLTQKEVDLFYGGFSNSTLWPYFHNLPTALYDTEKAWRAYRRVNQLFASVATSLSQPNGTVWVHDYQLMLVPELLRATLPGAHIGFFLHTPFPDPATYREIPHAKQLIKGVLGANLVGFHTPSYVANFLKTADEMRAGYVSTGQVVTNGRVIQVTDFPISIDYTKYAQASTLPTVKRAVKKLRQQYGAYKIILAFDRLDISKGFLERLQAYQEFLERHPRLHGKVLMIMVAAPSRTDLEAYKQLRLNVEELVDDINNNYGTPDWKPVEYKFQALPFEQVTALYQIADVCFITPIKDGMNLMAKEYVATNRKRGALILSQTAGAAEELTEALLVNPNKPETLVRALSAAFEMKPSELGRRLTSMQKHVATHTIQDWAGSFMRTLQEPVPGSRGTRFLNNTRKTQLLADYHAAGKRLILLDYDGVLARFRSNPADAKPTRTVKDLLKRIAADPLNTLVLVSGRSQQDMERWFGAYNFGLAAEHGVVVKQPGKSWQKQLEPAHTWKRVIQPVLQTYADKTPGAFVEEKDFSLVWHYRRAQPYYAQKNIVILRRALTPFLRTHGLGLFSGHHILEIKPVEANKGMHVYTWLHDKPDFVMAIGDDYTDEDLFAALPSWAHTIKVGRGRTAAQFRLDSIPQVITLLRAIADKRMVRASDSADMYVYRDPRPETSQ